MALYHRALSHYFSNCWPRPMALFRHLMRICCLLSFSHSPIHRQLLIIKRGGPLSHPYAPYGVPHPLPRAWRCPNPRHSSHLPPERRAVPRPHQLHCVNTMWCWSLWHVSNYTARWMEGWCFVLFYLLISPWTKWLPFHRWHFQMHFHQWKVLYSDSNFTKICSQGPNWR